MSDIVKKKRENVVSLLSKEILASIWSITVMQEDLRAALSKEDRATSCTSNLDQYERLNARQANCSIEDGTTKFLNEPELSVILGNTLELAEAVGPCSSLGDSLSSSAEDNVEIHSENTSWGVVLNSEINVLINTESEVAYSI